MKTLIAFVFCVVIFSTFVYFIWGTIYWAGEKRGYNLGLLVSEIIKDQHEQFGLSANNDCFNFDLAKTGIDFQKIINEQKFSEKELSNITNLNCHGGLFPTP